MRNSTFALSDGWYNFGKKLVQIILPAFGTFYFAMAGIWNLPNADKVTGTILAVSTFLGVCLGISNAQYMAAGKGFDGNMTMTTTEDGPRFTGVHLKGIPEDLHGKKQITLKVQHVAPVQSTDADYVYEDDPPQNPATRGNPQ